MEQLEKANRWRHQRAAYEALSNSKKTELEELEVFNSFAFVANADIDANSGVNRPHPEPDIRCTVSGATRYFELGEITDQPVSILMAHALENNEITGCAFSQDRPFDYILGKKAKKHYQTNGAPVELLLYYRTQAVPPLIHFADLLRKNMPLVDSMIRSGQFQRIWIFDFGKQHVLWQSS